MDKGKNLECNPMRILHMIGSLNIGGSQTMIINLYNEIDRSKIQFDFIIDCSDEVALVPIVEALGAKVYVMPTFKGTNVMKVRNAWNLFFTQHPEYKILHSHVRSYASLYLPIAKKHGVKTIIHSHNISNGYGIKAVVKNIIQYPLRYQADYLFACSDKAGAWLFGKASLKHKNYMKIPNAIDSQRFSYNEEKRIKMRKELNIEDKFVVGNVGRLTRQKNHLFLLDIFAIIRSKEQNSCLLLVGDGDYYDLIEKKCKQLEIQDNVIILRNKSNVEDYYMAMDVFVFPSLWEGLGIVAIEAQTTGLPCIVSDMVPDEVDIGSELIDVVSLSDNAEKWADVIIAQKGKLRKNQIESTKKAGFDVKDSAYQLQQFYLKSCIGA